MSSAKVSLFSLGQRPDQVPPAGYAYKCDDVSFLKPFFYKLFVNPLAGVLTRRTVANDITFLSQLCSLLPVIFALCYAETAGPLAWALVAPLGFFGYVVLDHLDGTHARRTGTSSPLGELVDHWCDAWNGALVPMAWAVSWGASPLVVTFLAVTGALAYTLAISEHKVTGVLKLDRVGGNEGMMMMSGTFVAVAILGRDRALHTPLAYGYDVTQLIQFLHAVGTLGTCKNVIARCGTRVLADVMPLLLASALVMGWVALGLDYRLGCFMLAALSAIVAGRMVLARTAGLELKWDGLGLGALLVGVAVGASHAAPPVQLWTGSFVLAILVLRAFADFGWGAHAFSRWIRRGEALSLFVRPLALPAEEPGQTEKV